MNDNILKAIAVAAELTSTELTKHSLLAMESDLSRYPESAVMDALTRCRRELTGRLTLNAVLERIESADGRPAPDEAWAIAQGAYDEAATVVWSAEIQAAFELAKPLLELGDKVGARMAFRDAYTRLVREAREHAVPASWSVSLGWDAGMREKALRLAVEQGRLPHGEVAGFLPAPQQPVVLRLAAVDGKKVEKKVEVTDEQARENIKKIADLVGGIADRRDKAKQEKVTAEIAEQERGRAAFLADIQRLQSQGRPA